MLLKSRAPRLFVAEDDAAVLELVVTRLEKVGYEVRHARNGWLAFEGIQSMKPDAVILDISMPGMDGFGVLRSMRGKASLARIPVMMLTARSQPEDVRKALETGAQDYLAKPFNDDELLARVRRLVRPPHPVSEQPPAPPPPPEPAKPERDDSFFI